MMVEHNVYCRINGFPWLVCSSLLLLFAIPRSHSQLPVSPVSSSPHTTAAGPCQHGTASQVCLRDGDGQSLRQGLDGSFGKTRELDLVFLIDTTNQTNKNIFQDTISFVSNLVEFLTLTYDNFIIHPDYTRIAILGFDRNKPVWYNGLDGGTEAITYCQLGQKLSLVQKNPYSPTKVVDSLNFIYKNFTTLGSSRPAVLWMVTDASGVKRDDVIVAAANLKLRKIRIWATAVGQCPEGWFDNIDYENILRDMTTAPAGSHFACLRTWTNITTSGISQVLSSPNDRLTDRVKCQPPNSGNSNGNSNPPPPGSLPSSTPNLGIVVGIPIGVVLLFLIIILVVVIVVRVKARHRNSSATQERSQDMDAPAVPNPPVPPRQEPHYISPPEYVNFEEAHERKKKKVPHKPIQPVESLLPPGGSEYVVISERRTFGRNIPHAGGYVN